MACQLPFDDWLSLAGIIVIFDPIKEAALKKAWLNGEDPREWVFKKYLL